MGHNCSGPGLGSGSVGAGSGNPSLTNFTFRLLTAGTVYFQPTDVNGKDISGVLTAAAAAATNYDIADLFTLPAGTAGGYFVSPQSFWWNNSADATTPVLLFSEQGTFAIGSASGSNLPALLDVDFMDFNPYVFLDCTDKTTMFTAQHATTLAGTTAVAATNDLVCLIEDKGSLGLKLRATTTARPAYDSTLFGGAGGLVFDGTSDFLKDGVCDNTIPKARTVLMVVNATNFTAARFIGGAWAFGSNNFGYALTITNGRPQVDFNSVSNLPLAAGSEITAATNVAILINISGDPATDGRLRGRTQSADLGVAAIGSNAIGSIDTYVLGGNDNGQFFLGSIGLLAEFPLLNTKQQNQVLALAANKFNL